MDIASLEALHGLLLEEAALCMRRLGSILIYAAQWSRIPRETFGEKSDDESTESEGDDDDLFEDQAIFDIRRETNNAMHALTKLQAKISKTDPALAARLILHANARLEVIGPMPYPPAPFPENMTPAIMAAAAEAARATSPGRMTAAAGSPAVPATATTPMQIKRNLVALEGSENKDVLSPEESVAVIKQLSKGVLDLAPHPDGWMAVRTHRKRTAARADSSYYTYYSPLPERRSFKSVPAVMQYLQQAPS